MNDVTVCINQKNSIGGQVVAVVVICFRVCLLSISQASVSLLHDRLGVRTLENLKSKDGKEKRLLCFKGELRASDSLSSASQSVAIRPSCLVIEQPLSQRGCVVLFIAHFSLLPS